MQRVARFFFAAHGARAAPLTASVPVLRQLPRVLEAASDTLARHPALAETAVRVALVEMDGFFQPYDAARFRAACADAFAPVQSIDITEVGDVPLRITLLRPDARRELADDLDLALAAARFAERHSRKARDLQAVQWIQRAKENVDAMIDLRQRAADQSYLRYRLRNDDRLAVPEVLWDYCNDSILTTRTIVSVPIKDKDALAMYGLKQPDLIATLIEAFFEMALGVGLYHAGLDAAGARVSIEPNTLGQLVLEADNPTMFFAAHEREFLVGVSDALLDGDHKAAARTHLE